MMKPSAETTSAHALLAALFDTDPTPTIVLSEAGTICYHNAAGQDYLQKKFIDTAQSAGDEIALFSRLSAPAQKSFFAEQLLPTLDIGHLLRDCKVKPISFCLHNQLFRRFSQLPEPSDRSVQETDLKTILLSCWHDIRNLLGITRNQIELIKRSENSMSNDAVERLQKIDEAAKTACEIANKMTNFQPDNVPTQDCNMLLKSAAVILTSIVPAQMRLKVEIWPESLPIKLTQAGLNNALINLVINAVDASADGSVIRIQCAEQLHPQIGRAVCVQVIDNGCGIDDSQKQSVRDAFHSNKKDQQLHGLGLFSVEQFVTNAGGVMDITDNSPSGTQFSLFFPWSGW